MAGFRRRRIGSSGRRAQIVGDARTGCMPSWPTAWRASGAPRPVLRTLRQPWRRARVEKGGRAPTRHVRWARRAGGWHACASGADSREPLL